MASLKPAQPGNPVHALYRYRNRRELAIAPSHHPPTDKSPLSARDELWLDYEGTPYLTGLTQVCSFLGVFIGALTFLVLLGNLQHGFARYWWLILVLVVDVAVNSAVRLLRARRRRKLGLTRSQRLWRLGLGPRPRQQQQQTRPHRP